MKKPVSNLSASVHQRLINLAMLEKRTFDDVLIHYANQRFLYRLSCSAFVSQFILKGAMAIINIDPTFPRATRDMDFLGVIDNSLSVLEQAIRHICQVDIAADGLVFDPGSVRGEIIKESDDYPGARIYFSCHLGDAEVHLQMDIGIADAVYPAAKKETYHSLLDLPSPSILIYEPETILAEKVETMVKKDAINSRVKDIFDIWWLASIGEFKGLTLARAFRTTFENRHTKFPEHFLIFEPTYPGPIQVRAWQSLVKQMNYGMSVPELTKVIEQLRPFLFPLMDALYQNIEFDLNWDPSHGWEWR